MNNLLDTVSMHGFYIHAVFIQVGGFYVYVCICLCREVCACIGMQVVSTYVKTGGEKKKKSSNITIRLEFYTGDVWL